MKKDGDITDRRTSKILAVRNFQEAIQISLEVCPIYREEKA